MWIMLAALLPTGLGAAVLFHAFWSDQRDKIDEELIGRSRTVASLLRGEFDSTISRLRVLATEPRLIGSRASIAAGLDEGLSLGAGWSHLVFLALDDNPAVVAGPPPDAILVRMLEGSRRLVAERWQPAVSDRLPAGESGSAIVVAVPVLRDEAPVGVLAAVMDLGRLSRKLADGVSADHEVVAMLDPQYRILLRSRDPESFIGRPISDALRQAMEASPNGVIRGETREGQATFTGYAPLLDRYSVGVATPSDPFDQALTRSLALLVCILAAMIGIGLLLSHWLVTRINRQLASTVDEAARLAAGEAVPPTESRVQELAVISESIRSLFERERAAREKEEAAGKAKDQFLAMLGHELRNPLASITTALAVMRERSPQTLAAERGILERQVNNLCRMVDDLLDVSRIAHGAISLERESLDMADVVTDAIETVAPTLSGRRIAVHTDIDRQGLPVHGDRARLCQVLANLLSNAARFSPPGSTVRITAAHESGSVVVRVIDEGSGFSSDFRERIFEPFLQGEQSVDRPGGGLGLGLSIARNFAQKHGGRLSAVSAGLGQGSTFTLILPAVAGACQPDPVGCDPAATQAGDERPTVLIVDDNVDAAVSLADLIGIWGYPTAVLHGGYEVVAQIDRIAPDVILMDIGLPGIDGYEVARIIRAEARWAAIRLIALTGYGQPDDARRSAAAGFERHLVKPVDFRMLAEMLEDMVK